MAPVLFADAIGAANHLEISVGDQLVVAPGHARKVGCFALTRNGRPWGLSTMTGGAACVRPA
jgi:hypothetical protein